MLRRALAVAGVLVAAALAAFFLAGPEWVERSHNTVAPSRGAPISPRARELHGRLLIADLHADSLLWGRDLLERGGRGHVDVPRLIEGHVALQGFTVVTKVPRGINIERNDDRGDMIFWLGLAQRWPAATWTSLRERAIHQARRLAGFAAASRGRLTLIRTRADLDAYLERRTREPDTTAGFLGIEGAHALDGDLASLDALFDAGFRMIAPTHFFDNDIGGSAHGVARGGLTAKGREMIARMERKGILLDLAHASERTFADAIAVSTRPVVVSHTGVRATCDNRRNLSDDQLRAVAGTGGVVGIGYWETAVCGTDAGAIARAVAHAVRVAGPEHVGLGSDFDGAVAMPFDTAGLAALTQTLLDAGLDDGQIAAVMGGNAVRVLRATLP